ncbi:MarR family transcriptional regulator [Terasakiella sp. A23]|uniref:MarR family winged helix-turn-helix transcriptional regulator n=1 Tax=Terasakiella sp. FCG-A23 TaxID=3080561 RepID=UPI002954ACDB|nr:MarR family transcriptional regulator [Terasakiella sp. A23]MDV7340490.1 MarR family transcriptional regulator [Terasakiella sp. A23]
MSQASGTKNIDDILAQWRTERPDIDPTSMAICGDIWRAGEILRQGVMANLKNYDLDFPQFDVILTLRRQGRGETLSPSVLAKEMMLSTSAMTNRLDRLEKRGLIERITDPNDRRGLKIALTDAGFEMVEGLVVSHVATEDKMLENLSAEESETLRKLLAKIS